MKVKMICTTSQYGPGWENKEVEARLLDGDREGWAWCKIGIVHRFIPVQYLSNV